MLQILVDKSYKINYELRDGEKKKTHIARGLVFLSDSTHVGITDDKLGKVQIRKEDIRFTQELEEARDNGSIRRNQRESQE